MNRLIIALCAAVTLFGFQASAEAQFDETYSVRRNIESPERFAFELRGGAYTPSDETAQTFFDDAGPMLALELDVLIYRLRNVGSIGVGGSVGWGVFISPAFIQGSNSAVDETSSLVLVPFSMFGVLRLDILPRLLDIPFTFAGKLGMDWIYWDVSTGERGQDGGSFGFRWGAQVALELDFFDRASARMLDEEWGINHSFLFFELYGSTANSTLPVGTDLGWAMGLGLIL